MLLLISFAAPQSVLAHATLTEAIPEQNSVNEHTPEQVSLTFNERLERGLYFIQVYDESGDIVTKKTANMSEDQRQLTLPLPPLHDGTYTVSYRVVSADGHPVTASYVFQIGHRASEHHGSGAGSNDAAAHHGSHNHAHHHHDHGGTPLNPKDVWLYAVKVWYYISLLLLGGLLIWTRVFQRHADVLDPEGKWLLAANRSFLLSVLVWLALQLPQLMETWALEELASLMQTSLGRLWAIHLALAFLGFIILKRNRVVNAVFVIALFGAKALSGHAAAHESMWSAVIADAVHLIAGALWIGGLLLIIANWKRKREEALRFMSVFTRFAWISIAVLVLTGLWLASRFLPGIEYLTYSPWGTVLLIKSSLVLLVVIVAAFIRYRLKRKPGGPGTALLTMDLTLAVLTIAAAAVLSGLQPVPSNEPLHWHEMGEHVHMTAQISPNAPGHNRFAVKVWLPEETGAPKQVRLQLVPLKRAQEPAPIDIPLAPSEDQTETDAFLGFDRYDYAASGFYMAFPGDWKVVVRILTPEDVEYVYEKQLKVY